MKPTNTRKSEKNNSTTRNQETDKNSKSSHKNSHSGKSHDRRTSVERPIGSESKSRRCSSQSSSTSDMSVIRDAENHSSKKKLPKFSDNRFSSPAASKTQKKESVEKKNIDKSNSLPSKSSSDEKPSRLSQKALKEARSRSVSPVKKSQP